MKADCWAAGAGLRQAHNIIRSETWVIRSMLRCYAAPNFLPIQSRLFRRLLAFFAAGIGACFASWAAPLVAGMIGTPDNAVRLVLPADPPVSHGV